MPQVERWLREAAPAQLLDETGVIGVHLLRTVPAVTQVKTAEGKLKGGEVAKGEEPWPWVLLVETGGAAFSQAVVDRYLKPAGLAAHGVAEDAVLGTHRLQLSMDEAYARELGSALSRRRAEVGRPGPRRGTAPRPSERGGRRTRRPGHPTSAGRPSAQRGQASAAVWPPVR